MTSFIHDDFLLQNKAARKLYHEHAAEMPIIDYHNHLPPDEIAADYRFSNLTEIWLKGDHYKWRAMRTAGVDERFITGDATDREKFQAWAETVPLTLKNPLYHWTHLELKRYFDVDEPLNGDTAGRIWDHTENCLQKPEFSTRSLLERMNVEVVCTTDDAADTLAHHQAYAGEDRRFDMYPTFRPDKAMNIEQTEAFREYVNRLEQISGISISGYRDYLEALRQRHDFFHTMGCRASDHGIEEPYAGDYTESDVAAIFNRVRDGADPSEADVYTFKSALMYEFARMDFEKGWVFQMHIGALRNNNTKGFQSLGPDTGFDSIGDLPVARPLSRFLDRLEADDCLPRTILYNLNPADNAIISTMIGNFMAGGIPGRIQHGAAWWFHDQKEGMEEHLQTLANMSLLSHFVGMVTDSRSFLSFPRHEYYRRVLCHMLGTDIEQGIIPSDYKMVGDMVKKLCYENARQYFSFK
jgi:glucuronate isomerase